jgi:hypothetical protein
MRDGFKVIDADRHVLEPSDLFAKYLPEKFRSRVEIKGPNQSYRRVDGELISDADRLRDATKQEDFGFTFAASKKWRETFADAGFVRHRVQLRDMDKGASRAYLPRPSHIMWRKIWTRNFPHLPRYNTLWRTTQRQRQAALWRRLVPVAGSLLVEEPNAETRAGQHLLAARQICG